MTSARLQPWRRLAPGAALLGAVAVTLAAALLPLRSLGIALAVVAICTALIASFVEPSVGLALAIVAGPLQPLERIVWQLPIDSGQLLTGIALLSYALRGLAQRRTLAVRGNTIVATLCVFLLIGIFSVAVARDLTEWAFECIKWLQMLLVCLIVANERDRRVRALILGAVLVTAFGEAVFGIVQHQVRGFGPKEFLVLGSTDRYRAYGTFEQPNPFGGYMGLTWPLAAGLALELVSRWRNVPHARPATAIAAAALFACAGLALYALNASGSRGALIGAAAAISAMALACIKHPLRWLGMAALAALIAFESGLLNPPASLESQLAEYGDIDVRDAYLTPISFSTIERLAHWQAAVRMIEARPFLGVGFGNYGAAYEDFRLINWPNALGHAHNYYLNIFAETGIPGLCAYLALWAVAIANALRIARSAQPGAWLALGVLGAFAHLSAHHLFDKLYVANMHILIGVYLGLLAPAPAKTEEAIS